MDVITMIGNTGTYLDSPFHRYGDGADLAGLNLETLVGLRRRGVPSHRWRPDRRGLRSRHCRAATSVSARCDTGWDEHFGTQRYESRGAVPECGGVGVFDRRRCGSGGHRLGQYRRHRVRR